MIWVGEASVDDAPGILRLIDAHAAFEDAIASVTFENLIFLLAADGPPTNLIVAKSDDRVIGYAALTFDFALWSATRFAYLDCLFVNEADRGGGIGGKLFRYALAFAEGGGATRMEWQTPSWNEQAVRFYEGQGAIGLAKTRFSISVRDKTSSNN